jgi:hypothetical protein
VTRSKTDERYFIFYSGGNFTTPQNIFTHNGNYNDENPARFTLPTDSFVTISVSLTGYLPGAGLMTANLLLQNGSSDLPLGEVSCYTNEAHSHKTFPTFTCCQHLMAGDYVFVIRKNYRYDGNDFVQAHFTAVPSIPYSAVQLYSSHHGKYEGGSWTHRFTVPQIYGHSGQVTAIFSIGLTGWLQNSGLMVANLSIQNSGRVIPLGTVNSFTNERHSHKTFPTFFGEAKLSPGECELQIQGNYLVDHNDFANVFIQFL